jgi:hypothetical protein
MIDDDIQQGWYHVEKELTPLVLGEPIEGQFQLPPMIVERSDQLSLLF